MDLVHNPKLHSKETVSMKVGQNMTFLGNHLQAQEKRGSLRCSF